MATNPEKRVIYLSPSRGIHDQRWTQALIDLGFTVAFSPSPDIPATVPVITGPLTTRPEILDTDHPVIGLSWGYDLHELSEKNDTGWLETLDGLIVDSTPTWDIAVGSGVDPERIAIIPWGIDLNVFRSTGPRALLSPPRIVTLRAHEELYRVDVVIDAVALLRDQGIKCTLTIGNQGSLTSQLHSRCQELGVEASFIGRVAEDSLPQLFIDSDVYVSAAITDGTSVTLLQAMAMSTPVVVSDSPGNLAWLQRNGTALGHTFPTGDSALLAQGIHATIVNRHETERRVHAARKAVNDKANWAVNINQLTGLIDHVCT